VKVVTPEDAAALVTSGSTVLVDGSGGGVNEPDLVLRALVQRFDETGEPSRLQVVHPNGLGDGAGSGVDRLAEPGLVRSVIGGHWGWSTRMQALAEADEIEAYCLPQGTMSQLLREVAAGRPGVITAVGVGSFVDPRVDGGRLNNHRARQELVSVVELDGQEWLWYRAFPIDVAIIRASIADEAGNLVFDDEGLFCEQLPAAQAARNSGGVVIAQVKHVARAGTLDPRRVGVPGVLVDAVAVDPDQRLSVSYEANPGLTGRIRVADPEDRLAAGVRRVIARRAASELRRGDIVNLGYGIADGVAKIAAEEGLTAEVTFTVEQGHIGGVPMGGSDFGLALNPDASIDATAQFDWYDGGGLDVAFLSFAEIDRRGRVNVSRFGGRTPGVGGFINIAHGARRLVFLGTLTAGPADVRVNGNGLRILTDAPTPKFVDTVQHVSFDAARAARDGKPVMVITERAVFILGEEGLELTEVAPGVELERDIISRMEFRPRVSSTLEAMSRDVFAPGMTGMSVQPPERSARDKVRAA
jgi:propionate CoA-transferase